VDARGAFAQNSRMPSEPDHPAGAYIRHRRGEFTITTDPAAADVDAVHAFLSRSYWAEGIPRETVARAIANSIPFSLFRGTDQVGLARVITDRATFAYLSDVYIVESCRGQGLSHWLMDTIMAHPDLQGLRRFSLTTRDADGLYRRYGFTDIATPPTHLEINRRGLYVAAKTSASTRST
jgi:ribosomal protein S18 acetylase RimI-like enzyme